MDGGHIQEAKSVKMGERLGTVDKKDGVKDGSQDSASCLVVVSGTHHRARQLFKRTRYERKIMILVLIM